MIVRSEDLDRKVLRLLRGNVFHVTGYCQYKEIIAAGSINSNRDLTYPLSFPQSEKSYGRKRGYICLYDLRNATDDDIDETEMKCSFYQEDSNGCICILFLKRKLYCELIPWTTARDEVGHKEMFIPRTECWLPRPLRTNEIRRSLVVKVKREQCDPLTAEQIMALPDDHPAKLLRQIFEGRRNKSAQ